MVCRYARLTQKPIVKETTEVNKGAWNPKTKTWDKWTEILIVPDYSVTYTYDYGFCCGVEDDTQHFATREAAEQFITDMMDGKMRYIQIDKEFMDEYLVDDA